MESKRMKELLGMTSAGRAALAAQDAEFAAADTGPGIESNLWKDAPAASRFTPPPAPRYQPPGEADWIPANLTQEQQIAALVKTVNLLMKERDLGKKISSAEDRAKAGPAYQFNTGNY
jgi:hypothetical protein